jgi:general secretion pathway protein B
VSFILDALRKSETERQREAAPALSRVPLASVRRETPVWILALLALLVLATVVLAAAWWRSSALVRATGSPPLADAAALPAAEAGSRGPLSSPASDGAAAGQTGRAEALGNGEPTRTEIRAEPETGTGAAPRPIGELAAVDSSQPAFRLDLIAYHPDPGRAYVRINGAQYAVGERIANGPTIVEIRRDGAVLAHRGETFLLGQR